MTLWVFDTDHLSLLERGNVAIQNRLQVAGSVAITIVTAEEKNERATRNN